MSESPIIDPERKDEMLAKMNSALGAEKAPRYIAFMQYEDPTDGYGRIASGGKEFCENIMEKRKEKYSDRPMILREHSEADN